MPFLTRDEAYRRFLAHGRNSSHFVWLLEENRYFETSQGWVFGFVTRGQVTLLALEPLIPGEASAELFAAAWAEFRAAVKPVISAFVSVYAPFLGLLESQGFRSIQIGHEPWVDLEDCIPRGNAGKGVRSARNQALRSGLEATEWRPEDIGPETGLGQEMATLLKQWRDGCFIELSGFLNVVDPFARRECRRYFGVRSAGGRLEAFLVATPVPATQSYFLEDLVIHPQAARGAGELITLEAMVALRDAGAKQASLGVVSVTTAQASAAAGAPGLIRFLLGGLPALLSKVYNFDGLEVFRKRFKPHRWETIHLAVCRHDAPATGTATWLRALLALLGAFRPRLRVSGRYFAEILLRPLRRYPLSYGVLTLSTLLFLTINRGGKLPEWALSRFGFVAAAPLWQWPMRSLVSDYLYFDRLHFLCCALGLWAALRWAERSHKLSFLLPAFGLLSLGDDFLNYLVVVHPFRHLNEPLFQKLVMEKDVGGSLALAAVLGLQLCQFRRNREIAFALLILATVLSFAYNSIHIKDLVLNLNHALFLSIGFIVGKLRFELTRKKNGQASKGKPPQARCVAAPVRPARDQAA